MNRTLLSLIVASILFPVSSVLAETKVTIVIGEKAPALEQFAAKELAAQFTELYEDVKVTIGQRPEKDAELTIHVGSPDPQGGNPTKLTTQGYRLRETDGSLYIGGGSPSATLWAVYEFGHQQGIRYLLRRDVFPPKKPLPDFKGLDITAEPKLKTRAWSAPANLPMSPEAWSVDDYKQTFAQLAKLKFNRVVLEVEPWHPYVRYEYDGIKKKAATLFRGETFSVDGETVGKKAFLGAETFENPDFAAAKTPDEMTDAGIAHLKGVIEAAHALGMKVSLSIRPLEFPAEFRPLLKESVFASKDHKLSIVPGNDRIGTDDDLQQLVATQFLAYLSTYPSLDGITFRLSGGAKESINELEVLNSDSIDNALQGRDVEIAIVFAQVGYPIESMRSFLEMAQSGQASNPFRQFNIRFVAPVLKKGAGVLPQSSLSQLGELMMKSHENNFDGFITNYWMPADFDTSIYFLSRVAWDDKITPRSANDDLWETVTGDKAAPDRLWLAKEHLESATKSIAEHDPMFAYPQPNMLMKHYVAEPIPKWWQPVIDSYTQYLVESYRSHGAADPRAKLTLFYNAKRSEFALEYLNAVKAVREAALAKKEGDTEKAIEHLETALEQTYNCINTLSDVARGPGDRGLIAALNKYAYRPLMKEYEALADSE